MYILKWCVSTLVLATQNSSAAFEYPQVTPILDRGHRQNLPHNQTIYFLQKRSTFFSTLPSNVHRRPADVIHSKASPINRNLLWFLLHIHRFIDNNFFIYLQLGFCSKCTTPIGEIHRPTNQISLFRIRLAVRLSRLELYHLYMAMVTVFT